MIQHRATGTKPQFFQEPEARIWEVKNTTDTSNGFRKRESSRKS